MIAASDPDVAIKGLDASMVAHNISFGQRRPCITFCQCRFQNELVSVILCTSPSSLYTCRVFITDNYMQPNLRATEVPGCSRVTCLLLAVIGISTQDLVLEFAVIVNGYSPRL